MFAKFRPENSAAPLSGQWIGYADGTNQGLTVVELDDCGVELRGHAYLFEGPDAPSSVVPISVENGATSLSIEARVYPFDSRFSHIISRPQLAERYPEFDFPTKATIKLQLERNKLNAQWQTDIGTGGQSEMKVSRATRKSEYKPDPNIRTWAEFKSKISSIEPHRYMFRGQNVTARLRTSFHRTRRKDLLTFLNQDIQQAHRVLTAQTKHVFRLNDPQENGAFWNLLQHHGYPTPLLDWTMSPFVAAFLRTDRAQNEAAVSKIFEYLCLTVLNGSLTFSSNSRRLCFHPIFQSWRHLQSRTHEHYLSNRFQV